MFAWADIVFGQKARCQSFNLGTSGACPLCHALVAEFWMILRVHYILVSPNIYAESWEVNFGVSPIGGIEVVDQSTSASGWELPIDHSGNSWLQIFSTLTSAIWHEPVVAGWNDFLFFKALRMALKHSELYSLAVFSPDLRPSSWRGELRPMKWRSDVRIESKTVWQGSYMWDACSYWSEFGVSSIETDIYAGIANASHGHGWFVF